MRITEVAEGIHQLTTYVDEVDLGFNQVLLAGEEPLLFHTGMRALFPDVLDGVSTVLPARTVRWIGFGHVEADESGSMNEWLAAAPGSTVVQGYTGCMVSIGDLADRPPRPLEDGEVLDIGGHRLRWVDTPHVPHGWEAGVLFDETTGTLLCGDLFARWGRYPPTSADDPVDAAMGVDDPSWSLAPSTGATLRRLAALDVRTLVPMHGPAFTGDCQASLARLADTIDERSAARRASNTNNPRKANTHTKGATS